MQIEIHSYKDVGQVLRDMRLHLKLEPREVAQQLHIRAKYLIALEEGILADLPGKVYARGYLRQYAEFLGLNAEEIATAFDRVQAGEHNIKYFVPEPTNRVYQPGFLLILIAFSAMALVYVYWYQTHKEIMPPDYEMVAPVPERLLTPVVPEDDGLMDGEEPLPSDALEEHEAFSNPLAVDATLPEAPVTDPLADKPVEGLPWRAEVQEGAAAENPVLKTQGE